ncbi:M23 family metallopeptidase [soil metagenome]
MPEADQTTTALAVSALHPPLRLFGSDGKTHLNYDLILHNVFDAPVTVKSIEVLDGDGGSLLRLDGDKVAEFTTPVFPGAPTAVVPTGGSLATVIDVVVPPDGVPERLTHRISYEVGKSAFTSVIGTTDIDGPELTVDPAAPTVIAPPVKGAEWLNANSCCDAQTPHRGLRLAVGGTSIKKPEEFAIDWVQMNDRKLFSGDGSRNEDWYAYGDDLLAVADGTVAVVADDMSDQTPLAAAAGITQPDDYSGNLVSLEISPGVFAIYAHAQPGSITVKPGDKVTKGQVIGKLGNSGNSSGPHLHFGLSDGPDILSSNSLPFVLDSYQFAGMIGPKELSDPADVVGGSPKLTVTGPAGPQTDTYPLVYSVTDFPT